MAAQLQFQVAGVQQVQVSRHRVAAGRRQRVLQDHQQPVDRQRLAEQPRDVAQEQPRGGQGQRLARAVVRDQPPAVQRRLHPPRDGAVGGDQRDGLAAFHRLADRQRDRVGLGRRMLGLDQGQVPGRVDQIAKGGPLGDPLIRHRRGPERQRDQPAPRGIGGGRAGPRPRRAEAADQRREPRLRMVVGRVAVLVEMVPDGLRRVEVEARQHHRAVGQRRDGLHEQARAAMRPGRSGDDHRRVGQVAARRPVRRQPLGGAALARLAVHGRAGQVEPGRDPQEGQRALPVGRVFGGLDPVQRARAKPFGLHLGHQLGQGRGQFRHALAGAGVGRDRLDQPRQLHPAGKGRGKRRLRPFGAQVREQPQARQQQRPPRLERGAKGGQGPARVRVDRDLGQRLGRAAGHAGDQPVREGRGEIDARRQRVEARQVSHRSALPRPASPRPGGCSRAAPRRTSARRGRRQRRARRRSACPTGG